MSSSVLTVAKWEFFRFFKWRDQLLGLISILVTSAIGFGIVKFARSSNQIDLAVVGESGLFQMPGDSKVKLTHSLEDVEQLRIKLEKRSLDGILRIQQSQDSNGALDVELIVRQQPSWIGKIKTALNELKSRRAVEQAGLKPELLQQIFSAQEITVTTTSKQTVSLADRVVAAGMGGFMVLVCFLGLSFFMVGITGEKQQRITEQIVSAISPQAWIDGKLIGLTAASFASTATLVIGGLAMYGISWLAGYGFQLPDSLSRWDLFPLLAILFLGGAIFWNCFFAAISSIINDPNTSAKSGILFLPMLPICAALLAITQPDGMAMRVLSLVPGTSSTAMTIRLLLGEVAWWEVVVCILGLTIGVIVLRAVAGRIFAAGIMLYGKEPNFLDVIGWAISRRLGN